MSQLIVRLLGRFSVASGDREIPGLESSKTQELLTYLSIFRDRPIASEALAGTLWPNSPGDNARAYLRKALWQLQNAFKDADEQETPPCLLVDNDWVQVNPEADVWIDASELESAYEAMQADESSDLAASRALMERAAEAYTDDLLPNCYDDWCLCERERLRSMYLSLLDTLVCCCTASGDYHAALSYAQRLLRCEPAHERTHRELMFIYYRLGRDRTAALRQYKQCELTLRRELGVEPSASTKRLREQIQRRDPVTDSCAAGDVEPSRLGPVVSQLLGHLRQLHGELRELQNQVRYDMYQMETAMKKDRSGQS